MQTAENDFMIGVKDKTYFMHVVNDLCGSMQISKKNELNQLSNRNFKHNIKNMNECNEFNILLPVHSLMCTTQKHRGEITRLLGCSRAINHFSRERTLINATARHVSHKKHCASIMVLISISIAKSFGFSRDMGHIPRMYIR